MTTADTGVPEREQVAVMPLLITLYTETPLHPGTGQSTGVIDLPVQRERHTEFPTIPATGIKGSLREATARPHAGHFLDSDTIDLLFGPRPRGGDSDLHAGALGFTDARLLAFPVRASSGVFLWVTCVLALSRLARDLAIAGFDGSALTVASPPVDTLYATGGDLSGSVVLEDLVFEVASALPPEWGTLVPLLAGLLPADTEHKAYVDKFCQHLVLIPDEDFRDLVVRATQVTARVSLNDKKTTTGDRGNLWYEETVPSDSLFYTLVRPEHPRRGPGTAGDAVWVQKQLVTVLDGLRFLQLGGNETVGHGWCALRRVTWPPPTSKNGVEGKGTDGKAQ